MTLPERLAEWLDIRPAEVRSVILSLLGAFFMVAFTVLGRSLREALYLTTFDITTLPYMVAAVAFLSLPVVGVFTRWLQEHRPRPLLRIVVGTLAVGLLVLWPFVGRHGAAIILLYLWTALGALLLTTGFWIVIAEHFPVRGAKRLYGMIGAGGTAGALFMGFSLIWITREIPITWLVPLMVILLALFCAVLVWMPGALVEPSGTRRRQTSGARSEGPPRSGEAPPDEERSSPPENLRLIWQTPHLRMIALIVFSAATASTLIDFQFKELAQATFGEQARLTSFFGAFYAWTGGIALILQLIVTSRLIAFAGVARSLAILPLFLLLGSAAFALAPGIVLITAVRGGDTSLRRSLYRHLLEYLYVPIGTGLRRRTKAFIDSFVDSLADGFGALLILLCVTLAGLPSRLLSILAIALAIYFVRLSRKMGGRYFKTIVQRLREEDAEVEELLEEARPHGRDLLSASFTRLDLESMAREAGVTLTPPDTRMASQSTAARESGACATPDLLTRLRSPHAATVREALAELGTQDCRAEHIAALIRLLARSDLYEAARESLVEMGAQVEAALVETLRSAQTDFTIRRRVPTILALIGGSDTDDALLDALRADRFEVRYHAAIALVRRRRNNLPISTRAWRPLVWEAIRSEVGHDRPIWELQKLLDSFDALDDELVAKRVGARGELSLEHTFRMLSLVLDPQAVRAAFHGVILDNPKLKGFALEYLEQVLPADIRQRLWLFIGDVSEQQQRRSLRNLDRVVGDLMQSHATLFVGAEERDALRRLIDEGEE